MHEAIITATALALGILVYVTLHYGYLLFEARRNGFKSVREMLREGKKQFAGVFGSSL